MFYKSFLVFYHHLTSYLLEVVLAPIITTSSLNLGYQAKFHSLKGVCSSTILIMATQRFHWQLNQFFIWIWLCKMLINDIQFTKFFSLKFTRVAYFNSMIQSSCSIYSFKQTKLHNYIIILCAVCIAPSLLKALLSVHIEYTAQGESRVANIAKGEPEC